MNNSATNNLTIPPNSSVAIPIGTRIQVMRLGTGSVAVQAGAGVTLRNWGATATLIGQYAIATIIKIDTDTWAFVRDFNSAQPGAFGQVTPNAIKASTLTVTTMVTGASGQFEIDDADGAASLGGGTTTFAADGSAVLANNQAGVDPGDISTLGVVKAGLFTVASLPDPTIWQGGIVIAIDCLVHTSGAAPTGGGSVLVPLYSDGSQWLMF